MARYRVWFEVVATTSVEIEAESEAEALDLASDEYGETQVNICHQCSHEISEPMITRPVEATKLD